MHICPLCSSETKATLFYQDSPGHHHPRDYYRCATCQLVFVPPVQYLSPTAEKAEYDLHQNSPNDQGYRRFLSRMFDPMQERIVATSHTCKHGLDFGSGPGPTLSVMFEEAGHRVALYDRFYTPDDSVFGRSYDFITATEVVEHLHHPKQELDRLWGCLKPGGYLGIMTKMVLDRAAFAKWHYKQDLTHVCFFSQATFEWISMQWCNNIEKATLTFVGKDVIIFQKVSR
ncbi:MAG: class I SAM-dependent methyltransferase [Chloroflexota bacterium]